MKRILFAVLLALGTVAAAQGAHTITLNWIAPVATPAPTGYNVYKFAGACGPPLTQFTKLTATPITALTFTDSGIADGVTACYQVTAVYAAGESGSSGALQVTTTTFTATVVLTPPGSPTATQQ